MAESPRKIDGPERAAVLLLALGQKRAAEILRHLATQEVQLIGTAMAELRDVTPDTVGAVLQDFVTSLQTQTALGVNSEEFIHQLLTDTLGEEKANGLIDRIMMGRNGKSIEQLKWMDARAVANMIGQEHPQIITIVLSLLDSDRAAEVLSHLSERLRADIVMRIATLESVQPAALKELDGIMQKQLTGNVKSSAIGGVEKAATILNFMESSLETVLLEEVTLQDPELGQKIQDKMFVFDNLVEVDDRGMQTLLREISSDSLLLALRGADDRVKDKIYRNMSKRAADMLREDLEASPPVKLSKVELAQKEILVVARRLAEAGELSLRGSGDDKFI